MASFACVAQVKKEEKKKIVSDSVFIPERQMKKLVEIENAKKELDARSKDILEDLLAVPENALKAKEKSFKEIRGSYIIFVKE